MDETPISIKEILFDKNIEIEYAEWTEPRADRFDLHVKCKGSDSIEYKLARVDRLVKKNSVAYVWAIFSSGMRGEIVESVHEKKRLENALEFTVSLIEHIIASLKNPGDFFRPLTIGKQRD